jgi:hypothetical protein
MAPGNLAIILAAALAALPAGAVPGHGQAKRQTPGKGKAPVVTTIRVDAHGAVGDGKHDDGPALAAAVEALRVAPRPARLLFGKAKTYRLASGPGVWAIDLRGQRDVEIDGSGSHMLLHPSRRMLSLVGCTRINAHGFSVDFDPLPFADGAVVARNATEGWVDVRVADGYELPPLGGPTGVDEQAYFAMLWYQGPYSMLGEHLFIVDTRAAYAGSLVHRIIRVQPAPGFAGYGRIMEGRTRISLPVRGIAHRMLGQGASPVFVIEENDDVTCSDIDLYSGPLFGVSVARNRGALAFRRFNIVPPAGGKRLTSTWRDGFHVKANYASLLWEDCRLEGMNDDAFNTATHSSRVVEAKGAAVAVRQNFPLAIVPFGKGDLVAAYDPDEGRRLGAARVVACAGSLQPDMSKPYPVAPLLRLTLDKAIPGLKPGAIVWNLSSANPHTVIRRCTIRNSCRFQSPVTLEECDFAALAWFYAEPVEGPLPSDVTIRNCKLRLGRGNPDLAVVFSADQENVSGKLVPAKEPVIRNVLIEGCEIDGKASLSHVSNVTLRGNRFAAPRSGLTLTDCRDVTLADNRLGDRPMAGREQVTFGDEATGLSTRYLQSPPATVRPLPRLRVRGGSFVEEGSDRPFQPRGFNYIRLRMIGEPGKGVLWHDTLNPATYAPNDAETALTEMQRRGFNAVRIFLDHAQGAGLAAAGGEGLSPGYLANLVDLLRRARLHRVRVILCFCYVADAAPYRALVAPAAEGIAGINQVYLAPGHVAAKALCMADVARAIKQREPSLLSTVFSYEIENESHYDATAPPFSLRTGTVTFDKRAYDMASQSEQQRLADDGLAYTVRACAKAVREVDPRALIGVSAFTFRAVGRSGPARHWTDKTPDPRFPIRPVAAAASAASYVDVHFYPGSEADIDRDFASIEWSVVKEVCAQRGKPLLVGEIGAFRGPYPTPALAAEGMKRAIGRLLREGFAGALYWTYDTREQDADLWHARSGTGQIMEALEEAFADVPAPQPPKPAEPVAEPSAGE